MISWRTSLPALIISWIFTQRVVERERSLRANTSLGGQSICATRISARLPPWLLPAPDQRLWTGGAYPAYELRGPCQPPVHIPFPSPSRLALNLPSINPTGREILHTVEALVFQLFQKTGPSHGRVRTADTGKNRSVFTTGSTSEPIFLYDFIGIAVRQQP